MIGTLPRLAITNGRVTPFIATLATLVACEALVVGSFDNLSSENPQIDFLVRKAQNGSF